MDSLEYSTTFNSVLFKLKTMTTLPFEFPQSRFNTLAGNQFRTKKDVSDAFHTLFEPLVPAFSPGKAFVHLEYSGITFDIAAAGLEGYARPLWGIVPFVLGGGEFKYWDIYRQGLTNGCDPNHSEYWGTFNEIDQRQVELCAVGFALALVPEHIWEPLSEAAKKNVAAYLIHGRNQEYPECNWKFFRVMVDLGLARVGVRDFDSAMTEKFLQDLDRYYVEDGWYRDGDDGGELFRIDYYNAFAMHYYGLIYTKLKPDDKERCRRYIERARTFAGEFTNWFADDGACVPYGRSLTYRFACGSFWGALAFADLEALSWGKIKGLYLRHMRWWANQPMMRSDQKLLTVGYAYPNLLMSEGYNSAMSPYWAMKAFIPLALGEDHPFWTAEEEDIGHGSNPVVLHTPGMVAIHNPKDSVLYVSGPERKSMPFVAEKYGKFAYSSRYAFSIERNLRIFETATIDNMIGFSEDGQQFRVRENYVEAPRVSGNILYSRWDPWAGVKVETWVIPQKGRWHVRVHRIFSENRELQTTEGGFSIRRYDYNVDIRQAVSSTAFVETATDVSGVIELSSQNVNRVPKVHGPEGDVNLHFPRVWVPQLRGEIPAGKEKVLVIAVFAAPKEFKNEWNERDFKVPDIGVLDNMRGRTVGIWK